MTSKVRYILAVVAAALSFATVSFAGVQNDKTQAFNLSGRGFVGAGDRVLIGGFIIGGKDFVVEVIRAIGPSLTKFGVGEALADPQLSVYDQAGHLLAHQDSFLELNAQDLALLALNHLVPSDQRECAIIIKRPAGTRTTAIVSGKNGATGVALVEAYKIE